MAGRSNTTLKKRQKEMARAEKQREKFAKRLEKKKGELGEQTEETAEGVEESALADPLLSLPVNVELSAAGGVRVLTPIT